MTPLDLTQRPPRSPRERLAGIAYLPRAIDKVRASLPGGALGYYLNLDPAIVTFSALFYRRMGTTHEEFVAVVAAAQSDDEVAAWLHARVDDAQIEKWHKTLLGVRLCDLDDATRERVVWGHRCAQTLPETTPLVDVLETDDAQLLAGT